MFFFCNDPQPIDIQECETEADHCHADANCTNTDGSFVCTCHTGHSGDGVTCDGNQFFFFIIVLEMP